MDENLYRARFQRGLPEVLSDMHEQVKAVAERAGLDTFPIVFELVSPEEMSMLAAYGGFPVRYPHWRWGMEF